MPVAAASGEMPFQSRQLIKMSDRDDQLRRVGLTIDLLPAGKNKKNCLLYLVGMTSHISPHGIKANKSFISSASFISLHISLQDPMNKECFMM